MRIPTDSFDLNTEEGIDKGLKFANGYLNTSPDDAYQLGRICLNASKKIKYKLGEGQSASIIGAAFTGLGKFDDALKYCFAALQILEEENAPKRVAECSNTIGVVYLLNEDTEESLKYFNKARSIGEQTRDTLNLGIAYANISEAFRLSGFMDSALIMANDAYKIVVKQRDTFNLIRVYSMLAKIHTQRKDITLGEEFNKKSLDLLLQYPPSKLLTDAYYGRSEFFHRRKNLDSAIEYARKTVDNAWLFWDSYSMSSAAFTLSTLYREQNNCDSALSYLRLADETKDSLFSTKIALNLRKSALAEAERQNNNIIQQNKQAQIRTDLYYTLGIAVLLFISAFGFLKWFSKSAWLKANHIKLLASFLLLSVFEFINLIIHSLSGYLTSHHIIGIFILLVLFGIFFTWLHKKLEHSLFHTLLPKAFSERLANAKRSYEKILKESGSQPITEVNPLPARNDVPASNLSTSINKDATHDKSFNPLKKKKKGNKR